MAVNKLDPKIIFASEAPAQDVPAVFTNKTVGWGESRKNGGRPTIKQSNALQQETDLKILWLNENAVTPYDATIDYPVNAVTIKDGAFKIFNGSVWNIFLTKSSVGLGNVDNTSDLNKPISTATQNALNAKADKTYLDTNLALKANLSVVKRGIGNIYDPTLAYNKNERVILLNGDMVKSTISNNTNNPNTNMQGWSIDFPARLILDDSGLTQQKINNMLHLANIEDLPLDVPANSIAIVYDDLRGGGFFYDPSRAGENNNGTCFNGWVRKYFGSVYLEWFCETDPKTTDCSIYMERALAVTRGVKAGGRDFLFTGRVGIPDIEQSNCAWNMIKIDGDGDTTFHIDCSSHGYPTFTSATAKANPTTVENSFVGKVEFKKINFMGVNTTKGWEMNAVNRNLVDVVFDGDRMYNSSAMFCNFVYLNAAMSCTQGRGVAIEGNNAYSQSFTLSFNHFYHCDYWAKANSFINFRCTNNQGERNYAGIKAYSKLPDTIPAFSVCTIDYNLHESGGVFLDVDGDMVASTVWNNYFEYNIFGDMPTQCNTIGISREVKGGIIGANNFGGMIDFVGYDTRYVDIRINGRPYDDSIKTDHFKSKPILLGNSSNSRQLITPSRGISIGNSTPYVLKSGWVQEKQPTNVINSMNAKASFENDVSFSRGIFNNPLNFSTPAVNGTSVSTLRASDASVIVAILDLSNVDVRAKNKMSTVTGELDCNLEFIRDNLTISNVSAKIHISIVQTGYGASEVNQYDNVRVDAKLSSIIQTYDIPIVSNLPANTMKKQFVEPEVHAVVEWLGGGRHAIRLTNYIGADVGTFGAPSDVYSSFTWRGSVGCRQVQEQPANNVTFINYWW